MDSNPMRMNWGCGPIVADGWVNVDNASGHPLVYRSTEPFPDGQFDGIVANHSLQCLTHDELDPMVRELARVLRPEGRLRVLVPDVVAAFEAWQRNDDEWAGFAAITEPWDRGRKLAHYLTWGGQNRSCFTSKALLDLVMRSGFTRATVVRALDEHPDDAAVALGLYDLDSRLGESLTLIAMK